MKQPGGGEQSSSSFQTPLAAIFPNQTLLSLEDIKLAANQIARTATFFPKPVDFRDAIVGDVDTKAVLSWEKVMKAKSSVGSYGSVKFDDPVIHSVISMMGGWVSLCRLEGFDSEKWLRVEFEKSY